MLSAELSFPPGLRLEARNLGIRKGYRRLFEKLDVTLTSGEIVQLIAPNGAGKSTLLRIFAGFSRADSGTIDLVGQPPGSELQGLLHYHGHREALREALTPTENLAFAAAILGGSASAIPGALDRLGVGRLADLPVQVLSAGQRRRVALARLLVAPRPIWFLDEPLAALDVAGQALVSELLADHARRSGMAMVATHQPLATETRILRLGEKPAEAA